MGKPADIFKDPLKVVRETVEKAKEVVEDPLKAVREGIEQGGKAAQDTVELVEQTITDPMQTVEDIGKEAGEIIQAPIRGTGRILEQARKDIEKFGETTGVSDALLQARDVGAELINVLDVADGFESPSEKKAKEEARAEEQRLSDAEAEAQRQRDLEDQISKDRSKLEQEKLSGEVDTTGVGLQDVRVIGAGTADEEEDEILRSLKKFGG